MQKIDGSQLISEITLDDLQKAVGGSISFCACVHKLRKMSGFSFVILRTGRYILQSVYSKDKQAILTHFVRVLISKSQVT